MTAEQQLTPVLEHIAADHGDRGQILDLLTARKARLAALHRRAAIGGSALAVAAAIAVVFTTAGSATGGSTPYQVPPAASQTPAAQSTAAPLGTRESSAMSSAEARSRASAAEQSARARNVSVASAEKAAAAAMQAAVGVCQGAWSADPVLAGDAVDTTAITALATACASAFGATSAPTITWVQTDRARAAAILRPDQGGSDGQDPVVLVLISGRFVGDTGDSTALLIIPSKPTGELGIVFSIDAQTVAAIGTLGAVHHG